MARMVPPVSMRGLVPSWGCRWDGVFRSRFTHSRAACRVTAFSGQFAHWGAQWLRHSDSCRRRVADSRTRGRDHCSYHSPTLIRLAWGSMYSPRSTSAFVLSRHARASVFSRKVFVVRLPLGNHTVACHFPDGSCRRPMSSLLLLPIPVSPADRRPGRGRVPRAAGGVRLGGLVTQTAHAVRSAVWHVPSPSLPTLAQGETTSVLAGRGAGRRRWLYACCG